MIQGFQGEPIVTTATTPEDVNEGARPEDGEKKGRVEVDGGLPGQQPDGQVDEAQPAVGVYRGVQVEGGGAYYCCQTG